MYATGLQRNSPSLASYSCDARTPGAYFNTWTPHRHEKNDILFLLDTLDESDLSMSGTREEKMRASILEPGNLSSEFGQPKGQNYLEIKAVVLLVGSGLALRC
jgi:hypothetical protein